MTQRKIVLLNRLCDLYLTEVRLATKTYAWGRLKESYGKVVNKDRAIVFSNYYWMVFANDGRKAIKNKLMFFYPDPTDDPRVASDYPRRRGQMRSLTREEIKRDKALEKLIVTRNVKRAPHKHFLQRALKATQSKATKAMKEFINSEVTKVLNRAHGLRKKPSYKLNVRFGR